MTATEVSGLVTTAAINIALCILFFALYSVLRKQSNNANLYYARKILKEKKAGKRASISLEQFVPSASWVKDAWKLSEDEILKTLGLDTLVFLRVFTFCLRFFGICTVVGLVVLLPVNYIQGSIDINDLTTDALDKFSISNVADGSDRLWVHFGVLYFISFVAYVLLYMEYRNIAEKRIDFLYNSQPQLDQFTILLRAIPKSSELSYSEQVEEFFQSYHPHMYLSHHNVYADKKLQKKLNKAEWLSREVEILNSIPSTERAPRKTGCLGLRGNLQDPLDGSIKQLEELRHNIKDSQSHFLHAEKELPVSFVSFKTRMSAAVAAQMLQSPNPLQWVTKWAPEPKDVNWASFYTPYWQLLYLRIIIGILFVLFIVLFFIPAGVVYTLGTLDSLETLFPFIQAITSIPVVSSLISGYLPSLLLTILLYYVPPVMLYMTKWESYPSCSGQEKYTSGKVFLFLVGNSFFIVTYGSLISLIDQVIEGPSQIPELLAAAVASQANFFMNFVMTKGWTGFATETLQAGSLSLGFMKKRVCNKWQYGPQVKSLSYFRALPNVLLFIFIGFVYAVLQPLLLPFLMIFFMMGYIVYRNQVVNLYEPAYETGGQYWPHVHNRVIASIFLMQVVCIGIFGVKDKATASSCSVPLLALTLIFYYYCNLRFYPIFENLPVQIAVMKDAEDEKKGSRNDILKSLETAYLCPTLQPVDISIPGNSNYEHLLSEDA